MLKAIYCLLAVCVYLLFVGQASSKSFGDLINVAPNISGGIVLGRTQIETALLKYLEHFAAQSEHAIKTMKVVYLPGEKIPDFSRKIIITDKENQIILDYNSRNVGKSAGLAFMFLEYAENRYEPILIVLRFDPQKKIWNSDSIGKPESK